MASVTPVDLTPAQLRSRALTEEANDLRAQSRWRDALAPSRAAVEADPSNGVAAYNLGVLLTKLGRPVEGEKYARDAIALQPNSPITRHALAHNLLTQGRFVEAWPFYDARAEMPELNTGFPTSFPFPRWQGESLAGKHIAVFPEQGFGDQIQFARFLPKLVEQGAKVTLLALPPLARLFEQSFPGVEIVIAAGSVDFPDPDCWSTLHDLPAAFGITPDTIPAHPYLKAVPRQTVAQGFTIGLMTKGNPNYVNDAGRSLPADLAERLKSALPGTIIELDPAQTGANDFADTAAIVAGLDLVVSVDTAVGHLAGALGKPCLLLIPGFAPDWRWMFERADSPWYPQHRLYRSDVDTGWAPAVDLLISDARTIVETETVRPLIQQAKALRAAGKPIEALAAARDAVALTPDDIGAAHTHGVLLTQTGDLANGEVVLRRIVEAIPDLADSRFALGVNLLAQGRYAEGWPFYEARTAIPGRSDGYPHGFPFPRWQGEDVAGKHIVLFPEQGLGDQIQFARFIPRLIERGAAVTLLAAPELERLFAHNFPQARVLAANGNVRFPDPDYWLTLAELPARLGVKPAELQPSAYLEAIEQEPARPASELRIGLITRGNPTYELDNFRSLPDAMRTRLERELPGTIVYLDPARSGARDMADTAAIIAEVDMVVSVDTAVAHLAGAMEKPCLLLIPGFGTDWRWMRGRDDSPWYARHRLYRSEVDGDWTAAIERLVDDVTRFNGPARQLLRDAAALRDARRFTEALIAGRKALALEPGNATALHNLARLLADLGQLKEAEALQRRAVAAAPQRLIYRYALGLNLLAQGRYYDAWAFHEARTGLPSLKNGFPQHMRFPRWRGEDLARKRIVILIEQGLGDQLQFARFLPGLRERGAEIVLIAPPPLTDLFRLAFPDITVMAFVGKVHFPKSDFWTTLIEVARYSGMTTENIPPGNYLQEVFPEQPPRAGFRIGVMTRGNPIYTHDIHRSLPDADAAALRRALPGELVELDPAISGAGDFADTARIIAGLDLVVSVDTSVGHLAGAMGKPCLLLIPGFATDWRWMRDYAASPWYPRHRLYRGTTQGDWSAAIERLAADARIMAGETPVAPRLGAVAKQLAQARRAAAAKPKAIEPVRRLGWLLTATGRLDEGETVLRSALALGGADAAQYDIALNLLAQGRYGEAWEPYRARRNLATLGIAYPRGLAAPAWEGQPLAGKRLLVLAEQGMGDTLQLARFLPQLIGAGAQITLVERTPLVRLLRIAFPSITVKGAAEIQTIGAHDYWTTTFDLLEPLDVTLQTLAPADYLFLSGKKRAPDHGFTVGLCTRGNPRHPNDRWRSLPEGIGAALRSRLPGVVMDLTPERTGASDFADTAAIVAELDLIVSVDTAVAHLAGAMGKPCLLLLPGFGTDWRWMRGRADSPWYPRHRLFRSDIGGGGNAALDAVVAHAGAMAEKAASGSAALPS